MTLEIRMFKKDMTIHHTEAYDPDSEQLMKIYTALVELSRADIITGFHLNIDTYSPYMDD